MHRLPYRPGLDAREIKCVNQLVSRTAESFFVNQKAAQPVGVKPVGRLRHKQNAGKVSKRVPVAEGDSAALFHAQIEDLQLTSPNAREHVTHAVVVANFRVLICDAGTHETMSRTPTDALPSRGLAISGKAHADFARSTSVGEACRTVGNPCRESQL